MILNTSKDQIEGSCVCSMFMFHCFAADILRSSLKFVYPDIKCQSVFYNNFNNCCITSYDFPLCMQQNNSIFKGYYGKFGPTGVNTNRGIVLVHVLKFGPNFLLYLLEKLKIVQRYGF